MNSEKFSNWRALIHKQLEIALPAVSDSPELLHQAMRYSTLASGKRLRPLLVYAAGTTLGASIEDLSQVAVPVELIHVYSLIHDDLPAMDDDDLRRGIATCHIAFNEATAILAGDALQTLAFEWLTQCPLSESAATNRLAMIKALAQASGTKGMGGGQALDLDATGKILTLQQLSRLHGMKTGALIRASVQIGAFCAEAVAPQNLLALDKFAQHIGLAFQIQDDILDIEGSTEKLGKPQGSDVGSGKATYPSLLGLEGAKNEARRLVSEALQALEPLPYNTSILQSFAQLVIERDH